MVQHGTDGIDGQDGQDGDDNAFIITPIQADSASINAAEAGAYSFTIPNNTVRLGLPSGHYFMRAYQWDVSNNDAVQEAINLADKSKWLRTNSTGEWSTRRCI